MNPYINFSKSFFNKLRSRQEITLVYFFYVLGCFMKKFLSIVLSFSILSVAFLGCYTTTYASDDDFEKYLQVDADSLTDNQKSIYDSVYGSDGWHIGSDGYLYIKGGIFNNASSPSNSCAYKLMQNLVPRTGISANAQSLATILGKSQMRKDFVNWFQNNIGDMNLKNGVLSIGKNAMSAWGDVFRNNCYDMGGYKLITNNIDKSSLLTLCNSLDADGISNLSSLIDSYDTYFFSPVLSFHQFIGCNDDFFLVYSKDYTYFYHFNSGALEKINFPKIQFFHTGKWSVISGSSSYLYNEYTWYYHGLPLKVFSSSSAAESYYGIHYSSDVSDFYSFDNFEYKDIDINLSAVKNTNYEQIFNNTYNTINEEKNTYITNNSSISEDELQKIIEKALEKYISDTGDSGGSSGGDSGGSSSGGTTTDLSGIEKLLKSIEHFLDLIEQHTGWTDTRLELTNSVLSNMQTVINTIGDTLTGQQDILKEIRDLLDADSGKSIFDHLGDILDNTIGELLGNLLKDLVDFFIGDGGIVEAVSSPASALASTAQTKFPTSIPWDIIAIIRIMSAEPQPPKIDVPFKVERLGIDYTIKIDLSKADKVAELSRNMLTVTFLLFLTIQTRKLYGAMSKN